MRLTFRAVISVTLVAGLLSACGGDGGRAESPGPSGSAGTVGVSLDPVPYELLVPGDIADRLTVTSLEDQAFLDEVLSAGATAAVEVRFAPSEGDPITYMTAYLFPEAAFDAAQRPDSPPPYGVEVRREGGNVLSVRGPFDMPFDPDSEDGRAWSALFSVIGSPDSYRAA